MLTKHIDSIIIEVTTECPLHCPFCYCLSNKVKHMPLESALYWIREAKMNGVSTIGFSGGEVLCYPYLIDVIQAAHSTHCAAVIATSGLGLTPERLHLLQQAGIDGIHISLNGSTDEINGLSRNGYSYAINALQSLYDSHYFSTAINFVLMKQNAQDLSQMINLAEQYQVGCLSILCLKPNSKSEIELRPTSQQMKNCAEIIDNYKGKLHIQIESCYSELIGLLQSEQRKSEYLHPLSRICRAGINSLSINIDGKIQPCRHINYPEDWLTIEEYLTHSTVIHELYQISQAEPMGCHQCSQASTCRPCLAVRLDIQGSFKRNQPCPLSQLK